MAAFRAAIAAGCGIECDARLSLDGEPMLFHDHDLRRLCASGLTVESTPADRLGAQRLFDSNQPIPRLAELLELVAGSVPLLVEVKCHDGNSARIAARVADMVSSYAGPVGVMSFEPAVASFLRAHAPSVRRGLVISRRRRSLSRMRAIGAARPHFLAVDLEAIGRPWVARQRGARWVYCWTIASAVDRETAAVHADALIWEGDGRPRG